MKLGKHAFQTFFDVHTWTGVAAALVLYVMFFMGTFALFLEDLGHWQSVPRGSSSSSPSSSSSSSAATATSAGAGPLSPERLLAPTLVDPQVGDQQVRLQGLAKGQPAVGYYQAGRDGAWQTRRLDPRTGQRLPARSQLAEFLYRLHYLWFEGHLWLYYVAGFASVALLLAITTGVLIHLKDLVSQLDQFRPGARLRTMFIDLHKVLGVFGLPFQIVFAFSGALLVLTPIMGRAFVGPVFATEPELHRSLGWGTDTEAAAAGPVARQPGLGVDALVARVQQVVPGAVVDSVSLHHRHRQSGVGRVRYEIPGTFYGRGEVTLALADGRLLHREDAGTASETATARVFRWLYGVHFAAFGGKGLRLVLALLSLGTAVTLLTGNWIWLCRRESKRARFGNRLLARLTLAVGGGLVLATAAIFWANRLLPEGWPQRIQWEQRIFFLIWLVVAVWSLVREANAGAWVRHLAVAGLAFTLLPLAGALGAGRRHGRWQVGEDAPALIAVELTLALFGLALLLGAWAIQRHRPRLPARTAGVRRQEPTRPALSAVVARPAGDGGTRVLGEGRGG